MFDIAQHLQRRFPDSQPAQDHFGNLLAAYGDSGLAPHLRREIKTGDEQKLWACVWEAMLYYHFANLGFQFRTDRVHASGQDGPDFGLFHDGRTIWVEAVVPKPEGLPSEWLDPSEPGKVSVRTMPSEELLLRWTSVLRDKNCQLKRRVKNKVVKPNEPYVVAINSCMLSHYPVEDHGISQLPFVVEAVFPIGPMALPLTSEGGLAGDAAHTLRYSIAKPTGVHVPTDNFLKPEYSGISAVIGCSRKHMLDGDPCLIVVHNPLACNSVSTGLFGAQSEYVAQKDGATGYLLTTVVT